MTIAPTIDDLPKQYAHAEPEQRLYKFWLKKKYFHSKPDPKKKPFTIVIPPPNVTGALHLGHALNNTLQDILIRFKRMQGYNALWMPGTDHAGIATQSVVERRLLQEEKLSRHDLGREELVKRIWKWKEEYEQRILGQLKRIGASCDWDRTRFTLDPICAKAVRTTFFKLFKEGKIYRGKRLVNWDTYLQTAVSDDEVYHDPVPGSFWYIKYPVIDRRPNEPSFVVVATTRPETMLGDVAIAVHPEPESALRKSRDARRSKLESEGFSPQFINDSIAALEDEHNAKLPDLIRLVKMADDRRKVLLPIVWNKIPIIKDPWANPELGTGCVKITPAHDHNDYAVWQRHNRLKPINILNTDGTLSAKAAQPYRGLTISEARKKITHELQNLSLLEKEESREIDLAFSDRSKTPIEPFLADQWFVKLKDDDNGEAGLSQLAMNAVNDGRVRILPERYSRSYLDWLGEKRDWPVSRQLWWGHRIPVWRLTLKATQKMIRSWKEICKFTDDLIRTGKEDLAAELIAKRDKDLLDSSLLNRDTSTFLSSSKYSFQASLDIERKQINLFACTEHDDDVTIAELESFGFGQEPDVLDTWFSSALWPHSTLGWPEATPELKYYYPTSTLITSRDIITLWVARMVLTGLHNVGEVPFKEVFIHPKILDAFGDTMSKSKGNGVDPLDVIDKFGADAMRFTLADLTTDTQDVRMPVDFECPHCGELIEQTKKNRVLPRVDCKKCGKPFKTQWAEKPEDTELPRGGVVSERFEKGRNFCNKLWNASRFAMLNLEGYTAAPVTDAELAVEDRWILSRLNTVAAGMTDDLEHYRYAEAMRKGYEFAWDEFCSFYVEMVKGRMQDAAQRPAAQRVLAHVLDAMLRLLHPAMPFITEEIWQRLKDFAPSRGLANPQAAAESVMIAEWPTCDATRQDAVIEARFARFQEMLRGLRDIRAKQNILPKTSIRFSLRSDAETGALLSPMAPYFGSLAGAEAIAWGVEAKPFETTATLTLPFGELFVDLEGLIDFGAEITRKEKERDNLANLIKSKEAKLSNASFVDRAPADVVAKEKQSLEEARKTLDSVERSLTELRTKAKK